MKGRKIHWNKCNLQFRKCGIKDCEWSKIPEKCGIKECEWSKIPEKCGIKECEFWTKFAFFNSAFFCSAGLFSALLSSLKVYIYTVKSRYLEYSISRTLDVSNKTIGPNPYQFTPNDYSISRTLDVSNKFVGPLLTVRDIESWLYI